MNEQEIFENRCRWAAELKKEELNDRGILECKVWKGTSYLTRIIENREHDCCLGFACKVLNIPRTDVINNFIPLIAYNGEERLLPREAQIKLNISAYGDLTPIGSNIATELTGERYGDLSRFNDAVFRDDITLFNMGVLIQWLLIREYLFGEEVFRAC